MASVRALRLIIISNNIFKPREAEEQEGLPPSIILLLSLLRNEQVEQIYHHKEDLLHDRLLLLSEEQQELETHETSRPPIPVHSWPVRRLFLEILIKSPCILEELELEQQGRLQVALLLNEEQQDSQLIEMEEEGALEVEGAEEAQQEVAAALVMEIIQETLEEEADLERVEVRLRLACVAAKEEEAVFTPLLLAEEDRAMRLG